MSLSLEKQTSFAYPPNTVVTRCSSLSEKVVLQEELGSGTYATVKKCHDKKLGGNHAIKVISEETFRNSKKQLVNEVTILSQVPPHPRLLSLKEIVRVPGKHFCIITELATGGDLFDFIITSPNGQLRETMARNIMLQLLEGLEVLHSMNIVHRDLKPENVLMVQKEGDVGVKICDFGLATFIVDDELPTKSCGTTGYTAPEVLSKQPYGKPCDMWSLGVILYAMVHGYLPFHADTPAEVKERVLCGQFRFSRRTILSDKIKDLIRQLLSMDPEKRPTVTSVREHPWFH
jgi:calcium/calmodulin-dependent protein kinase I